MTIPQLPEYVAPFKPVPNVQPFTYTDHVSHLEKLTGLVRYVNKVIVPFVNKEFTELGDDFETQVNILIDAVNAAITAVINDSVQVQDAVVATIFDDSESATRAVTDLLYAAKSVVDNLVTLTSTGRLSQSQLDATYGAKTAVDNLNTLVTTGRLSQTALDGAYASKSAFTTLSGQVTALENDVDEINAEIATLDTSYADNGLGVNVIASYFLTANEAMHLAVSEDGNTFVDSGIKWVPGTTSGGDQTATVRDPDLAYDATGSAPYLVVYTRPTTAGGGAFGTTNSIGVAQSTDLQTFTEVAVIAMPGGVNRTWAPDLYIDETNTPHIFVSLSSNAGGTFQTYELRATNAARTTWTAPVLVSGLGTNTIDATIVKGDDNLFHCFIKNETTKYIEHATASNLTGPYTLVDTGNWQGIGNNVEGPKVVRREDGGWRMYYDAYNSPDNSLYVDGDANFDNWTTPIGINIPMRHMGIMKRDNSGALRGIKPAISRHMNALGTIITSQVQQGSLDLVGDVYNGFTTGKTRISLVASNRASNPGNIYYTTGTAAGDQEHVFEFDRGPSLGAYVGFRVKQAGDDKAVAQFPSYSTATRPTAAAAGVGGTYFDTTLNRLVSSNGATWFNQDGVAV